MMTWRTPIFFLFRITNRAATEKLSAGPSNAGNSFRIWRATATGNRPHLMRDCKGVLRRTCLTVSSESPDSVIARWAVWANANAASLFNDDYSLKNLNAIPEAQRRCIKKIKVTNTPHGRNVEVEMFDAQKANSELAQMFGLLGKGDQDTTPPEETAKLIHTAIKEIDRLDGDPIPSDPAAGDSSETKTRLN